MLEALAAESSIERREIMFLALYTPPKQSRNNNDTMGSKYQQTVEDDRGRVFKSSA